MTARVPLAFWLPPMLYPAATPSRHDVYVSHLDLYPTIASLLGLEALAHHEGLSLLARDGAVLPLRPRDHFVESGEWLWPTPAVPADRIRYRRSRSWHGRCAAALPLTPNTTPRSAPANTAR